jgi:hypothetical protein
MSQPRITGRDIAGSNCLRYFVDIFTFFKQYYSASIVLQSITRSFCDSAASSAASAVV